MHLARNTDPDTSHEAAEQAAQFIADHHLKIIKALLEGPAGKDEIARRAKLTGVAVSRRLPELQMLGAAYPTGNRVRSDSGRSEREWVLSKV